PLDQVVAELRGRQRIARLGDYYHLHVLFPQIRRDTDGRALHDPRMPVDLRFELERRDVLPPPPDAVLDAIDEVVTAIGVVHEGVAGMEPAVAPSLGGLIRPPEVPEAHGPRL